MRHFDWKRIYEFAAGDISDPEIERHIEECARCRAEFERAKAILETLDSTEEPDPIRVSRTVQAAWDARREKVGHGAGFRLGWVLVPLALAVVIGVSILLATVHTPTKAPATAEVEPESNILAKANRAARELGLKEMKLDLSSLEQRTREIELDELGIEAPELAELPELTSSYLVEVLEVEDLTPLLEMLGTEKINGQTDTGRLV